MISDPDAQWAALRRQRGPRRRGLAGTLILSAALAVAALLALPAAGALEKRAMPTLFGPAALGDLPPAGGAPADAHPAYERTLYATVDAAMLGAAGPEKLALNLFADTTLTAVRTGVEVADDRTGKSTWLGRIEDDPLSTVVLSVSDRIVAGTIDTRNSSFVIGPTVGAKGVHTVAELDPGKLPPEGHPPLPNFKRAVQGDTNAQDTKVHEKSKRAQGEMWPGFIPVVDVLVAYTTAAKDYYGGTNNTLTSIDLGFDQTNAAFARSGVNVRVRLVRAIEINFSEGNMGEDLSRLQIKGDGILDELHTVRDQVGADLVSLWTTDYT